MNVLDLGCGAGLTPGKLHLPAEWRIVGVDRDPNAVARAARDFPERRFLVAAGEKLPFSDAAFDLVVANVALPYMNIPRALEEIRRVLRPRGKLWASLHDFEFTLSELNNAFPRPAPTLFRLYVLLNGILFHLTGHALGESFQTSRGIRLALKRQGFSAPAFSRDSKRWIVEATKVASA
jgi:ubiquinone/menaquinone biosynthesis C-methylase UbiE